MMKIYWQDVVMIIAMLSYVGVGVSTRMIISKVAGVEGFAQVAKELESNPVARRVIDVRYGLMITMAVAMSILMGIYYLMRRRWIRTKKEVDYLGWSHFTIALVFLFVHNLLNDLPILIGMIIGG